MDMGFSYQFAFLCPGLRPAIFLALFFNGLLDACFAQDCHPFFLVPAIHVIGSIMAHWSSTSTSGAPVAPEGALMLRYVARVRAMSTV